MRRLLLGVVLLGLGCSTPTANPHGVLVASEELDLQSLALLVTCVTDEPAVVDAGLDLVVPMAGAPVLATEWIPWLRAQLARYPVRLERVGGCWRFRRRCELGPTLIELGSPK